MGAPAEKLIPASILYENKQGLTKEQFVKELSKVGKRNFPFQKDLSLSYDYWRNYHSGLYGLANILNLEKSKKYIELQNSLKNSEYNYYPKEEIIDFRNARIWNPKFSVLHHTHKKVLGEFEIENIENLSGLDAGYNIGDLIDPGTHFWEIPHEYLNPKNKFQVLNCQNDEFSQDTEIGEGMKDKEYYLRQKLKVRAIEFETKIEEFKSIKDMVKKYPEYSAENIYNFDKKEFFLFPNRQFRWKKIGEKYFLDLEHLAMNLSYNSCYVSDANFEKQSQPWEKKKSNFRKNENLFFNRFSFNGGSNS